MSREICGNSSTASRHRADRNGPGRTSVCVTCWTTAKIETAIRSRTPPFRPSSKRESSPGNQQVVRVDREELPRPRRTDRRVVDAVREQLPRSTQSCSRITAKDFFPPNSSTESPTRAGQPARSSRPIPIRSIRSIWRKVTAVKPNRSEAFLAAGVPWRDPVEPASRTGAAGEGRRSLLEEMGYAISPDHPGRTGHDALSKGASRITFRPKRGRSSMFRARATPRSRSLPWPFVVTPPD